MDNWTNNPLRRRISARIENKIEIKSLATICGKAFLRAHKKGSLPNLEMTKFCQVCSLEEKNLKEQIHYYFIRLV